MVPTDYTTTFWKVRLVCEIRFCHLELSVRAQCRKIVIPRRCLLHAALEDCRRRTLLVGRRRNVLPGQQLYGVLPAP